MHVLNFIESGHQQLLMWLESCVERMKNESLIFLYQTQKVMKCIPVSATKNVAKPEVNGHTRYSRFRKRRSHLVFSSQQQIGMKVILNQK